MIRLYRTVRFCIIFIYSLCYLLPSPNKERERERAINPGPTKIYSRESKLQHKKAIYPITRDNPQNINSGAEQGSAEPAAGEDGIRKQLLASPLLFSY